MQQPSSKDEFMTVAEVADVLTVNQQTVRNWSIVKSSKLCGSVRAVSISAESTSMPS